MVIPWFSPLDGESASQETPIGLRAEDAGKGQSRPVMGRIGSRPTSLSKQADFQRVVTDERTGRTFL
jgi:hypothetical protein